MLSKTFAVAVLGVVVVTGASAQPRSGETNAQRQRIGINMVVNNATDTATFTVNRLWADTLLDARGGQLDSGRVPMFGAGWSTESLNGMKVLNVERHPTLHGKNGSLQLAQNFNQNEMQNRVHVQVGTWRIVKGTGAYARAEGGGRYVAVSMLSGRVFVRQEGWVSGLE